jgi:SAM-dependent methyltransferase
MMQTWTQGYVADVSYDYSYFPELAPTSLAFNLLDGRCLPPSLEQFTYCELGCGQGFTTNLLAATHPQGQFWGMDFNPTHIAEAQRLATAANLSNIQFSDHSFAEFIEADTPHLTSSPCTASTRGLMPTIVALLLICCGKSSRSAARSTLATTPCPAGQR